MNAFSNEQAMLKRLSLIFLLVFVVIGTACNNASNMPVTSELNDETTAVSVVPNVSPTLVLASPLATVVHSQATPILVSPPTATPSAIPLPTATQVPTPLPPDLSIDVNDIYLYPTAAIFAGDKVTFQILPHVPENVDSQNVTVEILVDSSVVASDSLGSRNHLSGEAVGLFEWAWDTSSLVGEHQVQVILDQADNVQLGDENPENNWVAFSVTVYDPDTLPETKANAIWKMAENNCCHVYVVSETAADRDLPELLKVIDAAVEQAVDALREEPQDKLEVFLIDRVIGQGGYAGSSMVVSYLDRDYVSAIMPQVLIHEAVHLIDRQFAPQRIPFLAEGMAVWASGGHYKLVDLDQATAGLVEIGDYVPLNQLIDNFYPVQHEIGYLEAAGFTNYLITKYGWPRFRTFYSDVTQEDGDTLAQAVNLNLQKHYNMTLNEFEAEWMAFLDTLSPERLMIIDLQTTIRFYNTVRRYQSLYDPSAHFLIAWLPSPMGVYESGNPADLTRHPMTDLNITLEIMLQDAGNALNTGNYTRARVTLNSIERVLDNDGQFLDPFGMNYWNIVQLAKGMGYEVQKVTLIGDQASAYVTQMDTTILSQLNLVLRGEGWTLSN